MQQLVLIGQRSARTLGVVVNCYTPFPGTEITTNNNNSDMRCCNQVYANPVNHGHYVVKSLAIPAKFL